MLETIEAMMHEIASGPDFNEFYSRYISDVQDMNIENELAYLVHSNTLTPLSLDALVNNTLEGLRSI